MAAITQADFLKAMQDVQGKITEVQQTASVQQIANEASREALKKDIKQMTEGVVDAATAKFTLLEQQKPARVDPRSHPGCKNRV